MTDNVKTNTTVTPTSGSAAGDPNQRITACIWFDGQAEDAARFYTSIFPNSSVGHIAHYGESTAQVSGQPAGSVMTVTFTIAGQEFLALNGGPAFKPTPAISFMVNCDTQEEIDHYWDSLLDGGAPMECGWLTDRFGISWQVVPAELGQMMKDPAKADRVMSCLLKMVKLDLAELRRAYNE